MRGKALVGVMSLILAAAAMLFVGCADTSLRGAAAAKDGSAIDWGGMTAAEAREMIERGELDPSGLYAQAGGTVSAAPLTKVAVAGNGDLDVLNALAEHGAEIDLYIPLKGVKAMTALDLALYEGNIAIARRLLELGADPSLTDDVKKTPAIHYALINSKLSFAIRKEMIDLLLAHGADINALDYSQEEYLLAPSPLMAIVGYLNVYGSRGSEYSKELIPHMAALGADVDLRHPGNLLTPMLLATWGDNAEVVRELARLGGDVNIIGGNGCWTPLFAFAMGGQNMEIFDLLLSHGADLDYRCANGDGILDLIALRKAGDFDIITSGDWNINREKFPTVEEWRAFGDVILARIVELCEAEEYAVCQELGGASRGVAKSARR